MWVVVETHLINLAQVCVIDSGLGGDGVWRNTVRLTAGTGINLSTEYSTQAEAQAAARELVRDAAMEG